MKKTISAFWSGFLGITRMFANSQRLHTKPTIRLGFDADHEALRGDWGQSVQALISHNKSIAGHLKQTRRAHSRVG